MRVRAYYSAYKNVTILVRGDEELSISDYEVVEFSRLLDRFYAHCDLIQPRLDNLFYSENIEPDHEPCDRVTPSDKPWEWSSKIPRTKAIMQTVCENPELIQYRWYEGRSDIVNQCFEEIKTAVGRKQRKRKPYPVCIDGPLEGTVVSVSEDDERVMIDWVEEIDRTRIKYKYVYEVTEGGLKYVRTHLKIEEQMPFTRKEVLEAVKRHNGDAPESFWWCKFSEDNPKNLDVWIQGLKAENKYKRYFKWLDPSLKNLLFTREQVLEAVKQHNGVAPESFWWGKFSEDNPEDLDAWLQGLKETHKMCFGQRVQLYDV